MKGTQWILTKMHLFLRSGSKTEEPNAACSNSNKIKTVIPGPLVNEGEHPKLSSNNSQTNNNCTLRPIHLHPLLWPILLRPMANSSHLHPTLSKINCSSNNQTLTRWAKVPIFALPHPPYCIRKCTVWNMSPCHQIVVVLRGRLKTPLQSEKCPRLLMGMATWWRECQRMGTAEVPVLQAQHLQQQLRPQPPQPLAQLAEPLWTLITMAPSHGMLLWLISIMVVFNGVPLWGTRPIRTAIPLRAMRLLLLQQPVLTMGIWATILAQVITHIMLITSSHIILKWGVHITKILQMPEQLQNVWSHMECPRNIKFCNNRNYIILWGVKWDIFFFLFVVSLKRWVCWL